MLFFSSDGRGRQTVLKIRGLLFAWRAEEGLAPVFWYLSQHESTRDHQGQKLSFFAVAISEVYFKFKGIHTDIPFCLILCMYYRTQNTPSCTVTIFGFMAESAPRSEILCIRYLRRGQWHFQKLVPLYFSWVCTETWIWWAVTKWSWGS